MCWILVVLFQRRPQNKAELLLMSSTVGRDAVSDGTAPGSIQGPPKGWDSMMSNRHSEWFGAIFKLQFIIMWALPLMRLQITFFQEVNVNISFSVLLFPIGIFFQRCWFLSDIRLVLLLIVFLMLCQSKVRERKRWYYSLESASPFFGVLITHCTSLKLANLNCVDHSSK